MANKLIKYLVIVQILWALGPWALYNQIKTPKIFSFSAGALLMWLNILLFFWILISLQSKQSKKGIALKMPIVVLKYAAWGSLIYFILRVPKLDGMWFVFGLCTWVISLLLASCLVILKNSNSKGFL